MTTSLLLTHRRGWRAVLVPLGLTGALVLGAAPTANAHPRGSATAQRHGAALAEAKYLMGLVQVPGVTRALHQWNPTNGPSPSGSGFPDTPDRVDLANYFVVSPGKAALHWLYAHRPHGGVISSRGSSSGPHQRTTHLLDFRFRSPVPYLEGELDYAMALTPSHQLALRVDAVVTWTPQKSPYATVAPGATTLTVHVDRGPNVASRRVSNVRVTSASVIASVRANVNSLAPTNPGVSSCPIDFGSTMTLQFFRVGATDPYAVVRIDPSGCGGVQISERAPSGATLGVASALGGRSLARAIATRFALKNWIGRPSGFATPR